MDYLKVAVQLNAEGHTAANGKPFTGNSVRGILFGGFCTGRDTLAEYKGIGLYVIYPRCWL